MTVKKECSVGSNSWENQESRLLSFSSFHLFFKYILLIMLFIIDYHSCPLHPPVFPSFWHPPSHQHPPPYFMSMGRTCKFFGFSISYTILTLPLSIFYLPFTLFPVFSSLPLPTDNPPCDLYFCDSVPVPVFCLVSFCFCFGGVQLLTVVSLLSFYCLYFWTSIS